MIIDHVQYGHQSHTYLQWIVRILGWNGIQSLSICRVVALGSTKIDSSRNLALVGMAIIRGLGEYDTQLLCTARYLWTRYGLAAGISSFGIMELNGFTRGKITIFVGLKAESVRRLIFQEQSIVLDFENIWAIFAPLRALPVLQPN